MSMFRPALGVLGFVLVILSGLVLLPTLIVFLRETAKTVVNLYSALVLPALPD